MGARELTWSLALLLAIAAAQPASSGELRGKLTIAVEGIEAADAGPIVVYLDGVGGRLTYTAPTTPAVIRQQDASFKPSFLAIAAGQTIETPNDDRIYHNVFSYSRPNDFDLGLYPGGESRTLTLGAPGIVRIYCSIHESMDAVVFVAPSRWFDVASSTGSFRIRDVPPGRYKLEAWSDRLPLVSRIVEVTDGSVTANLEISGTR